MTNLDRPASNRTVSVNPWSRLSKLKTIGTKPRSRIASGYPLRRSYLRLRAIMMEHFGALFDIDNAENNVVTLYCY